MSKDNCQKELWNGCCCCNCANHLEDFYHCTTEPKPEGANGCVCSTHKGWICRSQFEDSEEVKYHSGWSEHGMCEMHRLKYRKHFKN